MKYHGEKNILNEDKLGDRAVQADQTAKSTKSQDVSFISHTDSKY